VRNTEKKTIKTLGAAFMANLASFETYSIQGIAGEFDSGSAFFPEGIYVDQSTLNDIIGEHNHFPCNTTGKTEVWTNNPDLKARTQWECINYVSQDDLRELGCNSLFEFLVNEDGEYYSLGTAWQPNCLSVTWSDGDQKDVEAAICDHLDSQSLAAQQGL
jgi:hypothetical protein